MFKDDQFSVGQLHAREEGDAELEAALRRAVEADGLSVVYQPMVQTGDARVFAVEALLRWHEEEPTGTVSTSALIPIAERVGLMERIGTRVLETACNELAAWHAERIGENLMMHVNLSTSELVDPRLVQTVELVLSHCAISPGELCIEVTELGLARGGEAAEATMHGLEALGVRLVLDDFGSESSIPVLCRYEFDFAKLDRELFAAYPDQRERERLVRGLLGMARSLGTTLIAERIEFDEELAAVEALGILKVQGYATGRPMAAEELRRLLLSERPWAPAA